MRMFLLDSEGVKRLGELAAQPLPPQIAALRQKIEAATRAAEIEASITGVVNEEAVQIIVQMKLELDGLYMDWAEGKLPGKANIVIAR